MACTATALISGATPSHPTGRPLRLRALHDEDFHATIERIALVVGAGADDVLARAAAKTLSIDVQIIEYRNSEEMLTALDLGLKENPQAVVQLLHLSPSADFLYVFQ